MMGHLQVEQAALFYEFSLEKHVPADHLLRSIDRFVELGDLRRELAPFYSTLGRPSVDPELIIRMLIVGYCFGIRSERRLCEEVHLNLAYRWFCRLGLDGQVLDHSTFCKNRHGRFRQSDLLRRVFETVLQRCIDANLTRRQYRGVIHLDLLPDFFNTIGPKRTWGLWANWQTIVFGSNLRLRVNQVANKQPNGQEVAMSERYNLELISRRRAFSFLGLTAALSVAVPATVLIATDAEARVGNPGSAVSVAGANRRDRRQDRRNKKSPTTPTTTGQGEKK
jgi:transposase